MVVWQNDERWNGVDLQKLGPDDKIGHKEYGFYMKIGTYMETTLKEEPP